MKPTLWERFAIHPKTWGAFVFVEACAVIGLIGLFLVSIIEGEWFGVAWFCFLAGGAASALRTDYKRVLRGRELREIIRKLDKEGWQ